MAIRTEVVFRIHVVQGGLEFDKENGGKFKNRLCQPMLSSVEVNAGLSQLAPVLFEISQPFLCSTVGSILRWMAEVNAALYPRVTYRKVHEGSRDTEPS